MLSPKSTLSQVSHWILLIILLLLLVLRFVALDSDLLSCKYQILWGDENLHNTNARDLVLFNSLTVQHSAWFPLYVSPLHTLLMYIWFSMFGLSTLAARLLAAVFGILLLFVFMATVRSLSGEEFHNQIEAPLALTVFLFMIDYSIFYYSRIALPEIGILCFILVSVWLQMKNVDHFDRHQSYSVLLSILCGLSLSLAVLLKLSALIIVLSLLLTYWAFFWIGEHRRAGYKAFACEIGGFLLPGLVVYGVLYLSNPEVFVKTIQAQAHRAPDMFRLWTYGLDSWQLLIRQNIGYYLLIALSVSYLFFRKKSDILNIDEKRRVVLLAFLISFFASGTLQVVIRRQIFWFPLGYLFVYSFLLSDPSAWFTVPAEVTTQRFSSYSRVASALLYSGFCFFTISIISKTAALLIASLVLVASVFFSERIWNILTKMDLGSRWITVGLRAFSFVAAGIFIIQNISVMVGQYMNVSYEHSSAIEDINAIVRERTQMIGREPVIAASGIPIQLRHRAFFSADYVNPLDEYSRIYGEPDIILSIEYRPGEYYYQDFVRQHDYSPVYTRTFPYFFQGVPLAKMLLFEHE